MTHRPLCLAAGLLLALLGLSAQEPPAAAPARPSEGPFALADYAERDLQGWTVHVHPALVDPVIALGRDALALLDHELFEAARALPPAAVERLRGVPIWLSLDEETWPGGVYHPSATWLEEHGHDPLLAGGIQLGVARNFLAWERDQPSMLIHELAHAWHHQVLGHDRADLLAAFAAARDAGTYDAVLRNGGATERAYALSNVQEYFAELTEAYFGTNDFYPFVRAELALHDPAGLAAVRAAWGG